MASILFKNVKKTYDDGVTVIDNLNLEIKDKMYAGFFGYVNGATISNVDFVNTKIEKRRKRAKSIVYKNTLNGGFHKTERLPKEKRVRAFCSYSSLRTSSNGGTIHYTFISVSSR